MTLDEIIAKLTELPAEGRAKIAAMTAPVAAGKSFIPNPGPQTEAYFSQADELFFGGAIGGGKSSLLVGLALNEHKRSIIFRREYPQIKGLVDEAARMLGTRDGYNGQERVWKLPDGRILEFGSVPNETDKERFQGRSHDGCFFDELAHFTESQYRFLIGWTRSTDQGQRCRVVAAGNPSLTAEGQWIVQYWAPWLDPAHPNPAKSGELRWFTTVDGHDREVDCYGPHIIGGKEIFARSRSFIGSRLEDNPDLMDSGYAATVEAMPEPMRTMLREGRFDMQLKGETDSVIPVSWIMAAQSRWKPGGELRLPMSAIGFDPAGGGKDEAVIAMRHGGWVAPLLSVKGDITADGGAAAADIVRVRRHNCPVIVDMGGGFGGAVKMRLEDNGIQIIAFNGGAASMAWSNDGSRFKFANKRAEAWWRMRELLSPDGPNPEFVALPPDATLRADLCAPRWTPALRGVTIENKDAIRDRLGRSPDRGDAVVMGFMAGTLARKSEWEMFDKPGRQADRAETSREALKRKLR